MHVTSLHKIVDVTIQIFKGLSDIISQNIGPLKLIQQLPMCNICNYQHQLLCRWDL